MSHPKRSSDLSLRLQFFAYTVSIALPLTASTLQAGAVFTEIGGGGVGGAGNSVHAAAIICSSVVIGLLTGKLLVQRYWLQAVIGIAVWGGVVTFSTITSTMAILTNSSDVVAEQIASSDQSRVVQASLEANLATIASLQAQIDAADPVRWRSKREAWAGQIAELQRQNQSMLGMQRSASLRGEGSSVASTIGQLEDHGVTWVGFSLLASSLLDAVPFFTSLAIGSLTGRRRQEEGVTGKKPQGRSTSRPNLHAVR